MQPFTTILAVLALAHSALADVYITAPVASTVGTGGQVLTVTWADDGNTPTVASIGPSTIDLYTGSVNQQTFLQNLAASVDVSKASSVSATITPTVGQSGNYYFVRFASLALKGTTNPSYPYEAFSAKFTLNSMTGTWNQTVLAQLDASTASSSSAIASATQPAASTASKASSASASASATISKSAAMPRLAAPGLFAGLIGVAGIFML